jgi:hypothetical protein
MQQPNVDFLEQHKGIYDTLMRAGYIQHLDHSTRLRLLEIAREEFASNYLCCLTCTADVLKMVEFVYGQYEKQKQVETIQEENEGAQYLLNDFVFPDDLDKIVPSLTIEQPKPKKNHERRKK